jgi:Leucine-rich repeat (LRR) protein
VSANTKLTELSCGGNNLSTLDVSANTKLIWFECSYNTLTELNVSANTELTQLYCYDNTLTELDVSENTELTTFQCYDNPGNSEYKFLITVWAGFNTASPPDNFNTTAWNYTFPGDVVKSIMPEYIIAAPGNDVEFNPMEEHNW